MILQTLGWSVFIGRPSTVDTKKIKYFLIEEPKLAEPLKYHLTFSNKICMGIDEYWYCGSNDAQDV